MEHRVQYLKDINGHYVGCIAIKEEYNPNSQYIRVTYQLSVLNPTDTFDKDVARQLALGRLLESPCKLQLPAATSMHQVNDAILRSMLKDSSVPSRARRAAKTWLRKTGRA